jgi:hypothetical protein
MSDVLLCAARDLIQTDAGGRGLATDPADNLLTACAADFADACRSLAAAGAKVLVVTGFPIADARPVAAETDGPLGALFLARALTPLGVEVLLAADGTAVPALEVGVRACDLQDAVDVIKLPEVGWDESGYVDWVLAATERTTAPLTHLLALERVGPSHTVKSVSARRGSPTPPGSATLADDFRILVPPERRDRCQSMRGLDLTDRISPAHLLFEAAPQHEPPIKTIGIGDGGNEIGMGKIGWDVIRRNIPGGAPIACRVPVDHLIVAGVSNWGAYGLATGVRLLRGAALDAALYDPERERQLLQLMIYAGPLVDGVTCKREPTVDGLPFERSAEVLRKLAELERSAPGAGAVP